MLTGSAKDILETVDRNGIMELDLGVVMATGKFLQDTLKNPRRLAEVLPGMASGAKFNFSSQPYWLFLRTALGEGVGEFQSAKTREKAIEAIKFICDYVTD